MAIKYRNIAFQGGGVRGIAYAGAIQVLEDNNLLKDIDHVAGTSAGAIPSVLLACNYTAKEIYNIVFNLDFKNFKDSWWGPRILDTYGLYKGEFFLNWLEKLISDKLGINKATFKDLKDHNRDLSLIATNLNFRGIQIFSKERTPNVIISEAARASMSIPLYFKAFSFSQGIPANYIFVDGGVLWNFPFTLWDANNDNSETIGIGLKDLNGVNKVYQVEYGEILNFALSVIETLTESQSEILDASPDEQERIITIDSLGYSSTNFNLTNQDKTNLYESGVKYTKLFLNV